MSANIHEDGIAILFLEYCSVVAGYVNTPTSGKSIFDGMVVEEGVKFIFQEQIGAFKKFLSHIG
ncbi:MAG: hypothetical protein AAB471_01495 [Patescibacteria group bacterium]